MASEFQPSTGPGDPGDNAGGPVGGGQDWLGALITLGGAIYTSETSKKINRDNIRANEKYARDAYAHDIDMWNRANAYNDPAAQMARLKAAGLNPNMIYGTGAASAVGNATGSLPRYNAPVSNQHYNPIDFVGALSQYQDMQMKRAQIDNVKANTQATEARTFTEAARKVLIEASGRVAGLKGDQLAAMEQYFEKNAWHGQKQNELRSQIMATEKYMREQQLTTEQMKQNLMAVQTEGQNLENQKRMEDIIWKKYENQWRAMGITSQDHIGFRMISRMLSVAGYNPIDLVVP